MNNEKSNERTDNADPNSETTGNDGRANSTDVGNDEQNDDSALEEEAARQGIHSAGSETSREETNRAVEDLNWGFSNVWNSALEEGTNRAYEPRSRMFATELGKAPVDVFLAMKGEEPSNLPNARSRRKFEAGNMWEWIVGLILKRAGIIQSAQERVETQYDGMCPVSGRIDFIAGGVPDYEKAKAEIAAFELPEMFYRGFERVIEHLEKSYPNGLGSKPLEVKSLSAYMYDALERTQKATKSHRLQLLHYLYAKNMRVGHIVYICRDDCRMMEIPLILNEQSEREYKEAIALRSNYYLTDTMPPLEKPILWDDDMLKFTKNNMGMAYSAYLTRLYGIKDQAEFDAKYQPMQSRFNRVLTRVAKADKMTAKNLEAIEEMKAMGFDVEALAKKVPVDAPEEEETTE